MNLADVFIRRPVAAVMLIAALVVFGIVSYPRVGVDLFPNVDFPFATVTVIYPGADPETMESEVAEPIEEELNTLGGIEELRSVNLEGVTQVIVQFELSVDADQAAQDVRERVAKIERDLPEGIEPPVVEKLDVGAAPILTVALSGELPIRDLTKLADDDVKEPLQRIQGVGGVDLVGGRDREIQVRLDPDKLAGLGLTAADVAGAIQAQNLEIPGGNYSVGDHEFSVKTRGQLDSAASIGNILLPSALDASIRIQDVAEVRDDMEEARSWSALNGERAVALVVRKQSGSNTVELAHAVHEKVDELRPALEARGIRIDVPKDNAVFIERSIEDVQFDLVFGGVLAVLIIFVMLVNWRATAISAIAIPTSVVTTFAFINAMGFTFNNMTMLALSLSIGILIDDAIVVIENIHRHLMLGKTAREAASEATREIFLPVLAMTSTIIAVFVPVALMKGIIGRFFYQFGLTVSFAVAVSMLVSFTLTPMASSRFLGHHTSEQGFLSLLVNGFMGSLERVYGHLIAWSLRHRLLTIGTAMLALAGSGALISRTPMEFISPEDRSEFSISVELPTGTNLEASQAFVESVAADLQQNAPGVRHVLATVGGGAQGQVNQGKIDLALVTAKSRGFSQQDLMAWVRERYADVDTAKITVNNISAIGGDSGLRSQPVQFYLRGQNLEELSEHAGAILAELRQLPGFVDLDTTFRGGKPELDLELDRERAASLGVPVASVATTVRALLAGDRISDVKIEGDATDITMRLADQYKQRLETLSGLQVRSTTGQLVDLANVVRVSHGTGPSRIERSNQQREVMVLAGLEDVPLGTAMDQVTAVANRVLPPHIERGFEGQASVMGESFGYMFEALVLAILLVYMILAAQFDSFVQPVTIMISLPLSVVGAFGGLYLLGMTLSIFSMIGIIMLMGLVTKNAILLVDFANQARAEGESLHDALVKAGKLRLRPILMTTAAMVFGMLPVALALSEGGETRAPMAVCVIGGLLTSTLLTLVVIPVVYAILDGLGTWGPIGWIRRRLSKHRTHEVPAQ
jgi:HAE1 family hydrophobic/amphiphilic exporter-1